MGRIVNGASLQPKSISCSATNGTFASKSQTELNVLGGDLIEINGSNFPHKLEDKNITIEFSDTQKTKCVAIETNPTRIVCKTSAFDMKQYLNPETGPAVKDDVVVPKEEKVVESEAPATTAESETEAPAPSDDGRRRLQDDSAVEEKAPAAETKTEEKEAPKEEVVEAPPPYVPEYLRPLGLTIKIGESTVDTSAVSFSMSKKLIKADSLSNNLIGPAKQASFVIKLSSVETK